LTRNATETLDEPRTRRCGVGLACALSAGCVVLSGCQTDSFLDPSIVGRWEETPTIVPILDRIAVIERSGEEQVEFSDVQPRDLVPEIEPYRARAGDLIDISIVGLFQNQALEPFQRQVDAEGMIDLPQIGQVYVLGMTREEIRDAVVAKMRREQIARDPVVAVVPLRERQRQFHLMGSVTGPGTYTIPGPDHRLLQALSVGGAFNQNAEHVFIIRQVPLTQEAAGRAEPPEDSTGADDTDGPSGGPEGADSDQPPPAGEDLLEIIDDLSEPPGDDSGSGSPGAFGSGAGPASNTVTLPRSGSMSRVGRGRGQPERDEGQPGREPVVDLIDEDTEEAAPDRAGPPREGETRWIYTDGRWIRAGAGQSQGEEQDGAEPQEGGPGPSGEESEPPRETILTQRIIRVPLKPLLRGDARYNVVIRPGDTVRVPVPSSGTIYMMGQVARPGAFQLTDKLTLSNAIAAAGGLSGIAIPERVDLTRMVGNDRAATIRVNLRAIMAGTQPDIYLKRNDRINVGTNFWALPVAVIRGGFRTNYGFGFLLDRNFGNDVFGAPPTDRGFN